MAEPTDGDGGGDGAATTPATAKERQYGVFKKVIVDLSDDDKIKATIEALRALCVPKDEKKPDDELKPLYLLVRLGNAMTTAPRRAVEMVGEVRDLDGTYEAIAENSRNEFPKVKSEVRRAVTIG